MDLSFDQLTPHHARLSIALTPEDYLFAWQDKLKEYARKVPTKGFRLGMKALPTIRRRMGKALLKEVVQAQLNEHLTQWCSKHEDQIMGAPWIDQEQLNRVSWKPEETLSFAYHVIIAPQVKLPLGRTITLPLYSLTEVLEESIQAYLLSLLEEKATFPQQVDHGQLLTMLITHPATQKCQQVLLHIPPAGNASSPYAFLLGKEKQASYTITQAQVQTLGQHVSKGEPGLVDLLGSSTHYTLVISSMLHYQKEPIEEPFFKKHFGGEALDEESFRARIKQKLTLTATQQVVQLNYTQVKACLMKQAQIDLPKALLLEQWEASPPQGQEQSLSSDDQEHFFNRARWRLIVRHIQEAWGLRVEAPEIADFFLHQVSTSGQWPDLVGLPSSEVEGKNLEERRRLAYLYLAQDPTHYSSFYHHLFQDKLIGLLADRITYQPKPLNSQELQALYHQQEERTLAQDQESAQA